MLCESLIQKEREREFFLSVKIFAISLKCELTELFEGKELLKRNCLKWNVI